MGLAVVKKLLAAKNTVVLLSRHPERCPEGVECIGTERNQGLAKLAGRKFDLTFDFLAYNGTAPTGVFDCFDPGVYILISTAWMVRLAPFIAADQEVSVVDDIYAKSLPEITYSYLIGKMHAEAAVLKMRKTGKAATILRLPIFWGVGEHTGRLDFYYQRISDGAPVICVDGGNNYAQIAWTEDIARAIDKWLSKASERAIWEAIPHKGTKARDIIKFIAKGVGKPPVLVDVPSKELLEKLPDYLIEEPLWREKATALTANNLFNETSIKPTPESEWLPKIINSEQRMLNISELRKKEIIFLEKHSNDTRTFADN